MEKAWCLVLNPLYPPGTLLILHLDPPILPSEHICFFTDNVTMPSSIDLADVIMWDINQEPD